MVLRESPIVSTQVRVRTYSQGKEIQTDSKPLFGAHPAETRPGKASEEDVSMVTVSCELSHSLGTSINEGAD